jgi:hypothetical protein
MVPWQQIIQAAVRARYMPTRMAPYRPEPRMRRGAGGCLKSLLLGGVLLFIALATSGFAFGWALLGM